MPPKWNEIIHESTINSHMVIYNSVYKLIFGSKILVAFYCYTVNIHLDKWLIRCDAKHAISWDLYIKHISTLCIKHGYHHKHAAG